MAGLRGKARRSAAGPLPVASPRGKRPPACGALPYSLHRRGRTHRSARPNAPPGRRPHTRLGPPGRRPYAAVGAAVPWGRGDVRPWQRARAPGRGDRRCRRRNSRRSGAWAANRSGRCSARRSCTSASPTPSARTCGRPPWTRRPCRRARAPCSTLAWTLSEARRTALHRAAANCHALGGDGIVGVRLRTAPFPAGGTCGARARPAARIAVVPSGVRVPGMPSSVTRRVTVPSGDATRGRCAGRDRIAEESPAPGRRTRV
jgi:hypothetical protein